METNISNFSPLQAATNWNKNIEINYTLSISLKT